jgi:tRNA A-37 threonylcarbamoyl transferase component Bud32/tetratricopeptide (TPR) repeat protein
MTAAEVPVRLASALADRYRIERELGQGGMATVYLAADLKHDRKVAVKVLKPDLAAVLGAERFVAEIRTTAALQHPHILPLFDSGSADGFLYYVMPFVEGETLRDRLHRERQLSVADSVTITTQVAAALAYAHERGVVHRDIKPDNIMFSSGHAVVTDFGIARAIDAAGGSQLTATGMAVGTPAYMSPEQSAGEADVDGRSDLYSLASVLFEMLAGEPPFTGQTAAAIIAKRLGAPTPQVRVVRQSVPASVDRALQKALQRAPVDRFATVTAFAEALRADAPRERAPMSRRTGLTAVVALGVLGALTLAAAGWWKLRGDRAAGDLNPDVIAVLPFRVGGDPGIAYLRESMLDLLNARLTGEAGPRTVEPRTTLGAWRRLVPTDADDLSEDDSRRLAASLGAGRVLLGGVVATPTELTLSGTLLRVSDGAVVANGSVAGTPDSVAVLVNRLTARLLSLEAGEERERLDGLATTSLEALQDYLAGQKAYRRGEYNTAMNLYGRALGRDSSFAQAAFGLVKTNPLIGSVWRVEGLLAIATVWRLRERLSARDVALLRSMVFVGPNYPEASSYAEVIAQAERSAAAAPDSPEQWLQLGYGLAQYGAVASIPDWPRRATEALDRAVALDSGFAPAVQARLFMTTRASDPVTTRRLMAAMEAPVRQGFADATMLWSAAVLLGDSAAARRWRSQDDDSTGINFFQHAVKLSLHSVQVGLPLADARWANATLRRRGATDRQRNSAWLGERAVAFAEGRLVTFDSVTGGGEAWNVAHLTIQAVVEPAYRAQALAMTAGDAPALHRYASGNTQVEWPPIRDCFVEMLRVETGDSSTTRQAIRRLREFATLDPPPLPPQIWDPIDLRVCPLLLETMLEHGRDPSGSSRLDALEEIMRDGPRWLTLGPPAVPVVAANWTIARLREAQGDLPRALAAIRRRESNYYPGYLWTLPAFLREEGRLAALVGDSAGARLAYDHYLTLRTAPDAPFRAQRDSVVAERAALGDSR